MGSYSFFCLFTFIFVFVSSSLFLSCVGQGMVALSPVVDHVENDNNPTELKKKESLLPPEKIDAHVKIATAHLDEHNDKSDRLTVKDKPVSLQNPDKHASEEFILTFLLAQYPRSESVEEQVEILQNLENFSHKWENGRDLFKATGALQEILLPALNSSHDSVRRSACAIFAIASQNNREVQEIIVSESGVIRRLIHIISFDEKVRSKALWALSALVRNFRMGQSKFMGEGGIPALVKVASFLETRKRCLNLVTDLLQEHNHCREDNVNELGADVLADSDCDEFSILEKTLKQSGWCDVILDSVKNIPGFDTEDQLHTVEAVAESLPLCSSDGVSEYLHIFRALLTKLKQFGEKEWEEEMALVKSILERMEKDRLMRDEL